MLAIQSVAQIFSKPIGQRSDRMPVFNDLTEQLYCTGTYPKRLFGEDYPRIQRHPGIPASPNVSIGFEGPRRNMLGHNPNRIMSQARQNCRDVVVAQVLKYLFHNDHVSVGQDVNRGVKPVERDVRTGEQPAIAVDQIGHDVAGMIVASEVCDPACRREVAAADIHDLGRSRQLGQECADRLDVGIDDIGSITAAARVEIVVRSTPVFLTVDSTEDRRWRCITAILSRASCRLPRPLRRCSLEKPLDPWWHHGCVRLTCLSLLFEK